MIRSMATAYRRLGKAGGTCLCLAALLAGCGSSHHATSVAKTATTTTSTSTTASPTTTTATSSSNNYVELEAALASYASCMRAHGVEIAPPKRGRSGIPELGTPTNTSTSSPQFNAALRGCAAQAKRAIALRYG